MGRRMSLWLAFRSIVWTLSIPFVVTGVVPWLFLGLNRFPFDHTHPRHFLGAAIVIAGAILIVMCIWEFAASGKGTLSPLDPPRQLVVRGLYRYVRNPMYLSATTILLGEVVITGSPTLLAYWAIWFTAVNLMVIGYEEPTLRRQFGDSYDEYTRRVHRWLPRIPS